MSDIAITVKGVYKDFKIAHERSATLKAHFVTILKGKKNRTIETQHALKDISFEIKKGEFFGIVGRNGSGKSTLLKMLAGIYQPTKGHIKVEGKLVPFIELGVGFNPELTGRENVFLNGSLLGFSEEEITGFYDEVVEFAELEQFMDKKLKNYSSGMQVRLAFSMAIRANADVLLIDEVLAVGDADFQRKCFNYFKQLKKEESTVVLVTHDMEAIREYCDRAALIESNKINLIGKPDDVAKEYMKLFSTNTADVSDNNRWGDGVAKTKNVEAKITSANIKIVQTIEELQKAAPDKLYAVGIRVRTIDGRTVVGTNTKLENVVLESIGKGSKRTITWTMPNILSDGSYLIDLAVQDQDAITTHDWWDEAVTFSVSKSRKVPYMIDPEFDVQVKSK